MSFSLLILFSPVYRIMVAVIILIAVFRVQTYLSPYKNNEYNKVEILALLAGTLTLLSGVVFTNTDGQNAVLNLFILLSMILYNVTFIYRWSYLLIQCLGERYKVFAYIVTIIDTIR